MRERYLVGETLRGESPVLSKGCYLTVAHLWSPFKKGNLLCSVSTVSCEKKCFLFPLSFPLSEYQTRLSMIPKVFSVPKPNLLRSFFLKLCTTSSKLGEQHSHFFLLGALPYSLWPKITRGLLTMQLVTWHSLLLWLLLFLYVCMYLYCSTTHAQTPSLGLESGHPITT